MTSDWQGHSELIMGGAGALIKAVAGGLGPFLPLGRLSGAIFHYYALLRLRTSSNFGNRF